MARTASPHPTDGELEILRVLWEHGPATLSEIRDALRKKRDVATTTVATMVRIMLDKGLVRRKRAGRGHQWSAALSQDAAARTMVGKLVDGVFDGSTSRLVSHLVEGGKLSEAELAELRTLIEINSRKTSRKGAKENRNRGKNRTA